MLVIGLLLVIASILLLANRRGIIENIYNDAANDLRAKMEQPDYDQEMLQQEARAIEVRVVRTDDTLLYGSIALGLLGLALFHAALLGVTCHAAASSVQPAPEPIAMTEPEEPLETEEDATRDTEPEETPENS